MSHKEIVDKIVQVFLNRLKEGIDSGKIERVIRNMVGEVNLESGDSLELVYKVVIKNIADVLKEDIREDSSEVVYTVMLNVGC